MALTAKIFVSVIISLFLFIYSAETLCTGSALKGFVECSFIPVKIANLTILSYVFFLALLAIWGLAATAICGWAEFAAAKERDRKQ